jgi:hypothetical protein
MQQRPCVIFFFISLSLCVIDREVFGRRA